MHMPFCSLEEQEKVKLEKDLTHALIHILPMVLSVSLVEYKGRSHSASFSLLIHHCFVSVLCKGTFSKAYHAWLANKCYQSCATSSLETLKFACLVSTFFVVDLRVQKPELF